MLNTENIIHEENLKSSENVNNNNGKKNVYIIIKKCK